jgi:uncharacterized protein (TIGR02588 family)
MASTQAKRSSSHETNAGTPLIEWVLGGIGVVLLVACIAFLIYEGVTDGEHPGAITASVVDVRPAGDQHVVTFRIHNSGSQTLSNLRVSGHLLDGEREVERAIAVLDYVPGRSTGEGGFYFRRDPREWRIEIQPEGFETP